MSTSTFSKNIKERLQAHYMALQLSLPRPVVDLNISLPEPSTPTTIYVDEIVPFTQDDWDKVANRLKRMPSRLWLTKGDVDVSI